MKAERRRDFQIQLIRSRMQAPGAFPLILVLDRMKPTFNIGKIIRTANAFGIREVHLVGIPIFNHRPSKGSLRHTRSRTFDTIEECHGALSAEGYQLVGLDPSGSHRLGEWSFPQKTALVIGHEEYGLSFDPKAYPGMITLQIPQFGRVQSLNASIAASIACFEYVRQQEFQAPTRPADSGSYIREGSSADSPGGIPLQGRSAPLPLPG